LLAECFSQAGLPDGAFNVVTGGGSSVGTPLVRHHEVRAISFTGSNEVGTTIRADGGRLGKPVQLELGGQNPAVVLSDADLDQAAEGIALGAMGATGQKCTATRRAIVHRDVYDDFRERLLEKVSSLTVGDPFDDATDLGPLVNQAALDSFAEAVERVQKEGATILTGGSRITSGALAAGYFVEPTVVDDVEPGSLLACEEVFAPLLGLIPADDYVQAVEIANSVRYGLSAAVFTSSIRAAERFIADIEAGVVHVNSQTSGAEAHVPFGGTKDSGFGPHEQGRAAVEFYTDVKTVYMTPARAE
jgi:acyl-CoA reductase-like NAD-dependent aldehyde dehydrogenase